MHPSFIRLAATQRPIKVIPQYKYYLRRIPDVGLWFSGIAAFFGWAHVWVWVSNKIEDAPGNRGMFY